jgi:uncharacterized protein YbaP (TraB family)
VGRKREFMALLGWRERRIKTVWRIEKEDRISFLVGTAHFSPHRFNKALTKLIQPSETVLFEGPLDSESMARVAGYGRQGLNTPSVYEALNPEAIQEINRQLSGRIANQTISRSYLELFRKENTNLLEIHTRGVRPWMAFFTIWSALLDWKYSMDMEAFHIAQALGKRICFLETIEDQLAALDGIPFDRIVNYLNHVEKWKRHKELFQKAFMNGEVKNFVSMTSEFPTRCEPIIQERDPIFYHGMKPFFNKGKAVAFVGVGHIPGMIQIFQDEGYNVFQDIS